MGELTLPRMAGLISNITSLPTHLRISALLHAVYAAVAAVIAGFGASLLGLSTLFVGDIVYLVAFAYGVTTDPGAAHLVVDAATRLTRAMAVHSIHAMTAIDQMPPHDWQPTDNQGYSMECANGCGATWVIWNGVDYPDGPCPAASTAGDEPAD